MECISRSDADVRAAEQDAAYRARAAERARAIWRDAGFFARAAANDTRVARDAAANSARAAAESARAARAAVFAAKSKTTFSKPLVCPLCASQLSMVILDQIGQHHYRCAVSIVKRKSPRPFEQVAYCRHSHQYYEHFQNGYPLPVSASRCPICHKDDNVHVVSVPFPPLGTYIAEVNLEERLVTARRIGDFAAVGTLGINALLSPDQYRQRTPVAELVEKHVMESLTAIYKFPPGYQFTSYHADFYMRPEYRNQWPHHQFIELLVFSQILGCRTSPLSYTGPHGLLMPYCSHLSFLTKRILEYQAKQFQQSRAESGHGFSSSDFGDEES